LSRFRREFYADLRRLRVGIRTEPHADVQSLARASTYQQRTIAREDAMHPLFVELFIHPEEADLLAEEEQQRTRQARRNRSRMVMTVHTRGREARPRRSTG